MTAHVPLVKPLLVQSIGTAFTAAVSFLLTLWLARQLGLGEFGRYATWLNLGALVLIALEGGWPTRVYRQLAQGASDTAARRSLAAGQRHIVFSSTLVVVLALLASAQDDWLLYVCLIACMAVVAAMNLVSAHMRGVGAFSSEAAWQSVGRAMSALTIGFVVLCSSAVSAAQVFAAWGSGLLLVLVAWGRRWLPLPTNREESGGLWSFDAWLLMPMALAFMWMLKGDLLLMEATGQTKTLYAACTRLNEAGLLAFTPLSNVLLGRFSFLCTQPNINGHIPATVLAWKFCALAVMVGVASVGLAVGLGEPGMAFLFGSAYAGAGALLPWVLSMLPFACSNMVLMQLAMAQHRERDLLVCLAVCGLLLAVGLPALETRWETVGVALAVAGCQAVLMCLLLGLTARRTSRQPRQAQN